MTDATFVLVATYWWFFIVILAVVVPGFIIGMFLADRKRNKQMENDTGRLDQHPDSDKS